jgi:hypothetical protein
MNDGKTRNNSFKEVSGMMNNNTTGARKRATDFPQALLDLFDHYVHGEISRRQFMDEATKFAVGGLTALAIRASQQDGRRTRKHLRRTTLPIPHTFTRAQITVFITTQHRVTTKRRPSWPGNARSIFSTNTCASPQKSRKTRGNARIAG